MYEVKYDIWCEVRLSKEQLIEYIETAPDCVYNAVMTIKYDDQKIFRGTLGVLKQSIKKDDPFAIKNNEKFA
jgi:hypothetical protein